MVTLILPYFSSWRGLSLRFKLLDARTDQLLRVCWVSYQRTHQRHSHGLVSQSHRVATDFLSQAVRFPSPTERTSFIIVQASAANQALFLIIISLLKIWICSVGSTYGTQGCFSILNILFLQSSPRWFCLSCLRFSTLLCLRRVSKVKLIMNGCHMAYLEWRWSCGNCWYYLLWGRSMISQAGTAAGITSFTQCLAYSSWQLASSKSY